MKLKPHVAVSAGANAKWSFSPLVFHLCNVCIRLIFCLNYPIITLVFFLQLQICYQNFGEAKSEDFLLIGIQISSNQPEIKEKSPDSGSPKS